MVEIEYHPSAIAEYKHALSYYKERSLSAVLSFQEQYEKIEEQIQMFPLSGNSEDKEYYRRYLRDFPYTLIYKQKENIVYILAVAHQRQHPDYWKDRMKDIP